MSLKTIDPVSLKRRLDDGSIVLVDIREPDEHARESIPGARLIPLSRLDAADFAESGNRPIVFHCRSGNRTALNADRLAAKAGGEAFALSGGLAAWKAAGLETKRDRSAPLEIMRQVQIAAGSLVLLGVVLTLLVSPWFLALSAFVGAGLTMAGITGFCGMARLLGAMPWNRHTFAH
jgi:rhodanese-related sulfurtransferase